MLSVDEVLEDENEDTDIVLHPLSRGDISLVPRR